MEIVLTEQKRLEKAFDYAVQNHSFHKVDLVKQADNVCVFHTIMVCTNEVIK